MTLEEIMKDQEQRKPIRPPTDADGQNPEWPGDNCVYPGKKKDKDDGRDEETTTVPVVR